MQSESTRRDLIQTLTVAGVTVSLSGCSLPAVFSDDQKRDDGDRDDGDRNQTETPMQSSQRQDGGERQEQVRNGRFRVTIDGIEVNGFSHVTIPESTTQLNGQTTVEDLEIERVVIKGDSTLRDWRDDMRQGNSERARRTVAVTLLSEIGEPVIEWRFTGAWVRTFDPPELSLDGPESVFESCTVSFDTMEREEF